MARICITGSTDGLGFLAAKSLLSQGHDIVLHARDENRAREVKQKLPNAKHVVIGDLSLLQQIHDVAKQVNQLGRFDAVIHNAGVYATERAKKAQTQDGLPALFVINTLAPYMLTALIDRPDRLIYLSSGMHIGAEMHLPALSLKQRNWNTAAAYSESKLYIVMLAFSVARRWPNVYSNAVDPGWVPTKMGGPSATDDLDEGYRTQVWLAVSSDDGAKVSGKYFYHRQQCAPDALALDEENQTQLISACQNLSGISI